MEAFDSKSASRITGVSLRQIQYWDERGFIRPSVKLAEGRGTKRLYSFADLVQLRVVKNLSQHGLSLKKVRRCIAYLKRSVAGTRSFTDSLRYLTDGEEIFLLTTDKNKILDAMDRDFVFSLKIGNLARQVHVKVNRIKTQPAHATRLQGLARKAETGRPPSA